MTPPALLRVGAVRPGQAKRRVLRLYWAATEGLHLAFAPGWLTGCGGGRRQHRIEEFSHARDTLL